MKSLLTGIVGAITTIATIILVTLITQYFFPPPAIPSLVDNVDSVKYIFIHSSTGLLVGKLFAGILGGLLSGFVISRMKGSKKTATIVGLLFSVLAGCYLVMVIEPLWFWLLLVFSFFPCSRMGYSFGSRRNRIND
ncbi:hypothetical protein CNR22_03695 [Sphingobacteriaceae bacterium]|nr:hypothetical protein CNR22_03695 [Sphingobacteriaceae bacterium]